MKSGIGDFQRGGQTFSKEFALFQQSRQETGGEIGSVGPRNLSSTSFLCEFDLVVFDADRHGWHFQTVARDQKNCCEALMNNQERLPLPIWSGRLRVSGC